MWKEAVDTQHLEPPVIAGNGEKLDVRGRSKVSLPVGGVYTHSLSWWFGT